MKFELKTENENYLRSITNFGMIFIFFAFILVFCDISIKLGIISRSYQIHYNCRLLALEKSKSKFEKLSRLSNLKTKQQIWEYCRNIVK